MKPMNRYKSPVYDVIPVPISKIRANAYNPNVVAPPEMKLLELSIWEDGYTSPCVCYYDREHDIYELVDGYHRYMVMKTSDRIYEREEGMLPVVVIDKDLSNRMASTIRHNRARGTHSIELMTNIVAELKQAGMSDAWIMKNIGMDRDELLRLKQVSGLAALFADKEFSIPDNAFGHGTGPRNTEQEGFSRMTEPPPGSAGIRTAAAGDDDTTERALRFRETAQPQPAHGPAASQREFHLQDVVHIRHFAALAGTLRRDILQEMHLYLHAAPAHTLRNGHGNMKRPASHEPELAGGRPKALNPRLQHHPVGSPGRCQLHVVGHDHLVQTVPLHRYRETARRPYSIGMPEKGRGIHVAVPLPPGPVVENGDTGASRLSST